MWKRTILVLFENSAVEKALLQWAGKHQCNLVWADPESPDLIAIGCFVLIIDRNLVKKDVYFQYLEFLKEVQNSDNITENGTNGIREQAICILIDNLRDLEFPVLDVVLQVDIKNQNAVQWIIHNIELASKIVRV